MTDIKRPANFNLRSMKSGTSRFMPNDNVINLQQVVEHNINDEEIVQSENSFLTSSFS